jgi:hypothetical protein
MRIFLITTVCIALCIAAYSDNTTNAPPPWKARVSCKKGNVIHSPLSPGDEVELSFFIQNVSTNILALSKRSAIIGNWVANPKSTNHDTIPFIGSGAWGSSFFIQPPACGWIKSATEYALLKPGEALRHTHRTTVPDMPATSTNIGYYALLSANDTGNEFGIRAWTGKIQVKGFTVPLVHTNATANPKKKEKPTTKSTLSSEGAPSDDR